MIYIKTIKEIEFMRQNGHILASILRELKKIAKIGVSSMDFEKLALKLMKQNNGAPSFKGFHGYPTAICFSLNEEIVHAIPREDKIINDQDLVSIDLGFYRNDFHSDMATSFFMGKPSKQVESLIETTRESLNRAIEMIRPGIRLGEVSNLIQSTIEAKGFSVIKELTGHGVGRSLHEDPHIFNYGNPKSGPILKDGMVLAIEPMASLGSDKIKEGSDGYAYITKDSSLSCHFEHTIAITKNGSEVLTRTLNS